MNRRSVEYPSGLVIPGHTDLNPPSAVARTLHATVVSCHVKQTSTIRTELRCRWYAASY
jgi:hypothetical protein